MPSAGEVKDIVKVIEEAVKGIIDAFNDIKAEEQEDALKRGKFTTDTVAQLRHNFPQFNFIVIHTKHHFNFEGTQGRDWSHSHHEVKVGFPIGSTIGFEIYGFKKGEFHRDGDGGFLNWAWGGTCTKNEGDGKDMIFVAP